MAQKGYYWQKVFRCNFESLQQWLRRDSKHVEEGALVRWEWHWNFCWTKCYELLKSFTEKRYWNHKYSSPSIPLLDSNSCLSKLSQSSSSSSSSKSLLPSMSLLFWSYSHNSRNSNLLYVKHSGKCTQFGEHCVLSQPLYRHKSAACQYIVLQFKKTLPHVLVWHMWYFWLKHFCKYNL